MYVLRRILKHSMKITDDWEEHIIRRSNDIFYLTDEEFEYLYNLPTEYNYHEFDSEFYIDRHPSVLEEGIDNLEFIEDYRNHLTDKFFVVYEYIQLEVDEDV